MYTPDTTENTINYTQIMNTFAVNNAARTQYQFKIENPLTSTASPSSRLDIVPVPS